MSSAYWEDGRARHFPRLVVLERQKRHLSALLWFKTFILNELWYNKCLR